MEYLIYKFKLRESTTLVGGAYVVETRPPYLDEEALNRFLCEKMSKMRVDDPRAPAIDALTYGDLSWQKEDIVSWCFELGVNCYRALIVGVSGSACSWRYNRTQAGRGQDG